MFAKPLRPRRGALQTLGGGSHFSPTRFQIQLTPIAQTPPHTRARAHRQTPKPNPPQPTPPPDHSLRSTSRDHSKPNYGRGCLMGGPGAARSHLHRVARSGSGTCARTTAPPHRASLGPRTPGPSSQHHFISAPALLRRAGCFARAQNNCSDI